MAKLTDTEKRELGEALESRPAPRGWTFAVEYPGWFAYSSDQTIPDGSTAVTVACTPDNGESGAISIEVSTGDGRYVGELNADVRYRKPLTPEKFEDLVRPYLDRAARLVR